MYFTSKTYSDIRDLHDIFSHIPIHLIDYMKLANPIDSSGYSSTWNRSQVQSNCIELLWLYILQCYSCSVNQVYLSRKRTIYVYYIPLHKLLGARYNYQTMTITQKIYSATLLAFIRSSVLTLPYLGQVTHNAAKLSLFRFTRKPFSLSYYLQEHWNKRSFPE